MSSGQDDSTWALNIIGLNQHYNWHLKQLLTLPGLVSAAPKQLMCRFCLQHLGSWRTNNPFLPSVKTHHCIEIIIQNINDLAVETYRELNARLIQWSLMTWMGYIDSIQLSILSFPLTP